MRIYINHNSQNIVYILFTLFCYQIYHFTIHTVFKLLIHRITLMHNHYCICTYILCHVLYSIPYYLMNVVWLAYIFVFVGLSQCCIIHTKYCFIHACVHRAHQLNALSKYGFCVRLTTRKG